MPIGNRACGPIGLRPNLWLAYRCPMAFGVRQWAAHGLQPVGHIYAVGYMLMACGLWHKPHLLALGYMPGSLRLPDMACGHSIAQYGHCVACTSDCL